MNTNINSIAMDNKHKIYCIMTFEDAFKLHLNNKPQQFLVNTSNEFYNNGELALMHLIKHPDNPYAFFELVEAYDTKSLYEQMRKINNKLMNQNFVPKYIQQQSEFKL